MVDIYKKEQGELAKLDETKQDCWLNISPPFDHAKLQELSEELAIPLDFLIDSLDIDERSRFEEEDGVKLIVLNTPIVNQEAQLQESQPIYITVPIGIILLPDKIVTISSYINPVIEYFVNRKLKNFDPANRSKFVLQLFERSVYYFLHYLKEINKKRSSVEMELYYSSRNTDLTQLLTIQKSLVFFVTTLQSNELMMMKIQRTNFLGIRGQEDMEDYLHDIIIDNSQANEMANVYTNILNGTMDFFASIISNNLTIVMKQLTSITIVLMVPTLTASFYGMNVDLPIQNHPFAFSIIFVTSLALSILLAGVFLKKNLF